MDPIVVISLVMGFVYTAILIPSSSCGENTGSDFRMVTNGGMYLLNTGDHVTLACIFETDNFNLFDNPVMWIKTQRQESSQINFMRNIYEPFATTNRFTAAFSATPPRFQMQLSIENLQREDSGNYTCEVKGHDQGQTVVIGEVTHHIFIRAPVDGIYFSTTNVTGRELVHSRTLYFNENDPSTLRCTSVGGYPPPSLQVHLGAVDITRTMQSSVRHAMTGSRGLRVMRYSTELVTHRLLTRPEHNGMTLRCSTAPTLLSPGGIGGDLGVGGGGASPGDASSLPASNNYTTARICVNFSPRITCEDGAAQLGRRNAYVKCEIRARPAVSVLFWVLDDNGTTLMATRGEVVQEYWTVVMAGVSREEGLVEARLFMKRALTDNFRSYMIVAENEVGISSQHVQLVQLFSTTVEKSPFSSLDPPTLAPARRKEQRSNFIYLTSSSSPFYPPSYATTLVTVGFAVLYIACDLAILGNMCISFVYHSQTRS